MSMREIVNNILLFANRPGCYLKFKEVALSMRAKLMEGMVGWVEAGGVSIQQRTVLGTRLLQVRDLRCTTIHAV